MERKPDYLDLAKGGAEVGMTSSTAIFAITRALIAIAESLQSINQNLSLARTKGDAWK